MNVDQIAGQMNIPTTIIYVTNDNETRLFFFLSVLMYYFFFIFSDLFYIIYGLIDSFYTSYEWLI